MNAGQNKSTDLPRIAVVSVTYNRVDPLLILLGQLRELDYDRSRIDIYLVDNGSTDGTVEKVGAAFPEVKLIELDENTGVSAGFNRSIATALEAPTTYDYLWLLDSDAEVEPNTLVPMVEAMQHNPDIGVAGSAVFDPNDRGRMVTAGLKVDWARGDIPLFLPSSAADELLDVDLIAACSMLTRASVYAEVGVWDNRFPLYWGDTDWCARVLRSGARVCCTPQSRVWHRDWSQVPRGFGAGSFIRDHLRGGLLYFLRHDPEGFGRGARRLMLKTYLRAALERLTLREPYAAAYEQAAEELLRGRFDRSFQRPPPGRQPGELGDVLATLKTRLPANPRIVMNQIAGRERSEALQASIAEQLPGASWQVIKGDEKARVWSEYRAFRPRSVVQHLGRRLRGFGRADVAVCDISNPLPYSFLTANHTLFVDGNERALLVESTALAALSRAFGTIRRGLQAAYLKLPAALGSQAELQAAISYAELMPTPTTTPDV